MTKCSVCDDEGWVQDETSCGDPDHCSSHRRCECNIDDHIPWERFIDESA